MVVENDDTPVPGGRPASLDLFALFTLVVIGGTFWEWNVVRSGETLFSLTNFDLYSEFFPRHSFAGAALRQAVLPLWDPYQIGGLPFLATYQGGVLYPPNLLYAFLPTGLAMGLLGLVHIAASGAFTYLLCRELGRTRIASWLAGLVFMVGGSTLFASFHTNAINSVPWLPAALCCSVRLARRADLRWALLLGLCVALQFLAGREFTFVMTVHTLGLFAAFQVAWMLRDGRGLRRTGRHLARLALGAAFAAGLVAVQALPTLALAAASGRTTAGLEGKFLEIYGPLPPAFFLANLLNPAHGAIRREYFGWIPLVCFLLGFRLWGRDRTAVFASLLALLALVLCFGSQTPLYAAYRALPLGATFRLPDRFVFLFSFGFALVAASGFDRLIAARGDLRSRARSLAPRGIALLAFGIALAFVLGGRWLEAGLETASRPWGWFAYYGLARDHFAAMDRAVAYFAAAVALLAVCAWRAHARGARALQVAVLVCAAADLGFALQNAFLHPAHDATPALAGAACYERVPAIAGEFGRHLSFRLPRSYALKDKDGELFARYSATHYDPLVTRRQAAYFAALEEGSTPFFESPWTQRSLFMGFLSGTPAPERMKLLDLLGTRVVLIDGRRKLRPPGSDDFLRRLRRAGRCLVAADGGFIPVDLYENPRALRRAFVVHRVRGAASLEEAIRRLVDPDFDPRREAVVEGQPPPVEVEGADSADRAEIASYDSTRVVVRVETRAPGLLVLGDSFDPDWVVTRNGEAATVLPTDGLFRGVFVPAGSSELVFRYRPRAFRWGAAISAAAAALGVLLWIRARPKEERRAGAEVSAREARHLRRTAGPRRDPPADGVSEQDGRALHGAVGDLRTTGRD